MDKYGYLYTMYITQSYIFHKLNKYPGYIMQHAVKWLLVLALITACTNERPEFDSLGEEVDYLIDQDEYDEALNLLSSQDRQDESVQIMLEKTHLNYGLYNMNTFDEREMRTRMNDALRQFTEVLRINPQNSVARTQIDQILQIYETIPDREPEEDVIAGLREIGIIS